jgi:hypothetical protein
MNYLLLGISLVPKLLYTQVPARERGVGIQEKNESNPIAQS